MVKWDGIGPGLNKFLVEHNVLSLKMLHCGKDAKNVKLLDSILSGVQHLLRKDILLSQEKKGSQK